MMEAKQLRRDENIRIDTVLQNAIIAEWILALRTGLSIRKQKNILPVTGSVMQIQGQIQIAIFVTLIS